MWGRNDMRQYVLIVILLAALCIPMACSDKCCTQPAATVTPVDTLVVRDISYSGRVRFDLGRLPIRRSECDTLPEPDKYDFAFSDTLLGIQGDIISRLIVFYYNTSVVTDTVLRFEADCFIDPDDTLSDDSLQQYRTTQYFSMAEPDDYYLNRTHFFVQFPHLYIGPDDIVAVYMEVIRRRADSVYKDTIGDISHRPLRLKLIKPHRYLDVNHHVWEYAWRNIYDLGRPNLDLRKFDLAIYRGGPINYHHINPSDLDYNQGGIKYIQILGLDQGDDYGIGAPDGKIDRYVRIDQTLGLLFFPDRHPFDVASSYVNDSHGDPVYLTDSVPEIYNNINPQILNTASQYYLGLFYRR
jgi:hypothetical protein